MINVVTSPAFPWSVFPIGGMGIGLFSHYPGFRRKERRLLRELSEEGVDVGQLERGLTFLSRRLTLPGTPGSARESAYVGPEIAEAERLRDSLLRQMRESDHPGLGEEFGEALKGFVAQIRELAGTQREIEQIISEIPREALQRDLKELRKKRSTAESERMKREYEKSIEEVEKQERSYFSLKEDAEMIQLRISSAMNALRQINIDLLRMRTASQGRKTETADDLRKRTDELSRYVNDLHSAYEELE
jgi:chromosome segregation ATPase